MTKRAIAQEDIPLLPTRRASFLNEYRMSALLTEVPPPVPVPRLLFADLDDGVLVFEAIEGSPIARRLPSALDPGDLDRAIAVADAISRFRPPAQWLNRLPITDHLRHHQASGALSTDDVMTIACAATVNPIQWRFAHGNFSAHNLLKCPDGTMAVIDWARAGIYPAGYDVASLWYTMGRVTGARARIEAATAARDRASFLLSALLIALLPLDRSLQHGENVATSPDRAAADNLIAQLDLLAITDAGR